MTNDPGLAPGSLVMGGRCPPTPQSNGEGAESRTCRTPSIPPEPLEPCRAQLGISDGVLDIPVSEPQLQRPCVVAVVRQLEAARVPEHVGMNGEGQLRFLAGARDQLADTVGAHRATPLRHEDESALLGPLAGGLRDNR